MLGTQQAAPDPGSSHCCAQITQPQPEGELEGMQRTARGGKTAAGAGQVTGGTLRPSPLWVLGARGPCQRPPVPAPCPALSHSPGRRAGDCPRRPARGSSKATGSPASAGGRGKQGEGQAPHGDTHLPLARGSAQTPWLLVLQLHPGTSRRRRVMQPGVGKLRHGSESGCVT